MKVHQSISSYSGRNAHVTMGIFDGVHPGHMALLHHLRNVATADRNESVVLTFWPHPRVILNPGDNDLRLLTTLEEKIEIIKSTGINHLVILEFNESISTLAAGEFMRKILLGQLRLKHLLVGFNHRFGKDGARYEQMVSLSRQLGFEISQFGQVEIGGEYPSSTKIRKLIASGNLTAANSLLGYPYIVSGHVTGGMRLGRQINYPTANLEIAENIKLLPPHGVYACKVKVLGEVFKGMVYIGVRPTVNNLAGKPSVEVHILDFAREIYSEVITLNFLEKVRDEIKFSSVEALRQQLKLDEARVRLILEQQAGESFPGGQP